MKRFLFLIAFVTLFINGFAQPRERDDSKPPNFERIHSIKIAFLTDRLQLTTDQSARFWPVYTSYETELRALRKSFFQKYKGADKNDDHVARQLFDDKLDFQAASVDLKRKYRDQFLNVLSPQQLASLFNAEHDFNMMLMQRANKDKRDGGGNWRDNDKDKYRD